MLQNQDLSRACLQKCTLFGDAILVARVSFVNPSKTDPLVRPGWLEVDICTQVPHWVSFSPLSLSSFVLDYRLSIFSPPGVIRLVEQLGIPVCIRRYYRAEADRPHHASTPHARRMVLQLHLDRQRDFEQQSQRES